MLKVMKGARVLVDCDNGTLHLDLGNGRCVPLGDSAPLILSADDSSAYEGMPERGDEALKAILSGRQILVRTPNADGGSFTAIYSPVLMYQLPNHENSYLYLFYLRDEKQDLSALLSQPAGTVQMPTYGQLKMKLSKAYNGSPLEPDRQLD